MSTFLGVMKMAEFVSEHRSRDYQEDPDLIVHSKGLLGEMSAYYGALRMAEFINEQRQNPDNIRDEVFTHRHDDRGNMLGGKKHQFYVQFLGWVESNGVRGARFTDPVINDLRRKAKKWKYAPKLTLQLGKKEMKITQDIQEEKKRGKKIKTIKFPIIPSRDITYAIQAAHPVTGKPDDIVACIYLGYVPRTQRYAHVHVYRFDSPDTASTFVQLLNQVVNLYMDRTLEIERQLIQQGQIEVPGERPIAYVTRLPTSNPRFNSSDGMSDRAVYEDSAADSGSFSDEGFPSGSDDIEPDLQSLKDAVPFDSVTDELKARLKLTETKGGAPLLLPPKDYDTVVRRHGDLDKAPKRKCLQIPIVGSRHRNGSDESGIEVPSPTSSDGKNMDISDERISTSVHSSSNGAPSPLISPRNKYDIYPPSTPRSPMTPRSPLSPRDSNDGFEYRSSRSSRPVSSSGISSRSSGNFSDQGNTVIYSGKQPNHISEIPPADYESEAPILRQKVNMNSRDLTRSMPASVLQKEMDYGYAVSPKRLNRHSAKYSRDVQLSPRVDMDYGRGVRRVNSMYR